MAVPEEELHLDGDQIISVIEGGGKEGLRLVGEYAGFVHKSQLKPECFQGAARQRSWYPTRIQWWTIAAGFSAASGFWFGDLERIAAASLAATALLVWRFAPAADRQDSGRRYFLLLGISAVPGIALIVRGPRRRRSTLSPEMRRLLSAGATP
jgi:hypothetical protein